ncbi:MAG: hypothetical protein JWQ89_2850 [Devosia sp.]|uniref:PQQ-dependent sugar dehydrogenase n=1 Tax=Devosia sp. TaxID=1871048 RepID=UPI002621D957|nr:PQQ-dependent sugar dehydrogenase [Devosia sp.]MDB5541123.1 hypothetical protein [Devosia sp.]
MGPVYIIGKASPVLKKMLRPRIVVILLLLIVASLFAAPVSAQQHKLTLVLAGDAFKGKPKFQVALGGVVIGKGVVESATETMVGTSGRQSDYLENFEFPVPNLGCLGQAPLEISMTNDLWEEGVGDRNIYVASATIDSIRLDANAFALLKDGKRLPVPQDVALLPILDSRVAVAEPPPGGWTEVGEDCSEGYLMEAVAPLYTSVLNFDLVIANPGHPIPGDGGGLAAIPGGVLIARPQDGLLWFYDREAHSLRRTGIRLPPINADVMPAITPGGLPIRRELLRYNDIEVAPWNGETHLLASYSYYDEAHGCVISRLAHSSLPDGWTDALRNDQPLGLDWKIALETTPCLGFIETGDSTFGGAQAGGRIAASGGTIYVTAGDYEIDGVGDDGPLYPQLADSSYGKVFSISLTDWTVRMLSMGHRNPQGITVDDKGSIWEVEQGPAGGDELNLIVAGENYGWPLATLGMDYGSVDRDSKFWPHASRQGRHDVYRPPVFAWLPSIAPSNLKQVEGVDDRWDGDLLVGSLAGESLVRLRIEGQSVEFAERIPMGKRIRYVQPAEGRIYLLFDSGEFGFLVPHKMLDHVDGPIASADEALRRNGCMACHSSIGAPRLGSIIGSDIAGQAGVDYSSALLSKPGAWTENALRAFLEDTQAFARGAMMPQQALSPTALDELVTALE